MLKERLQPFIDRLLPANYAEKQETDALRRARLYISFTLVAIVIYSVFFVLGLLNARPTSVVVNAVGLLLFGISLRLFKTRGLYRMAANILLLTPLGAMFIYQVVNGAFLGMNIVWAPFVPIISVLLLGKRLGMLWTVGSTLSFIAPSLIDHVFTPSFSMETDIFYNIIAIIFSSLACLVLVSIYQREKDEAYRLLDKKKRDLEAAVAENRNLLSVVTHDIANPLTVINNYSSMLEGDNLSQPDTVNGFVGKIKRAGKIIQQIIHHVRTIQALETHKKNISVEPVKLADIFKNAEFIFQTKLAEKDLSLNIKPTDATVIAESVSLSNYVFNNLISNAIKFSERGSVIDVEATQNGPRVRLVVQDHGVGMPKKTLDNLFRSDRQTSHPGTEGEKGTGFGMPLVKAYVEQYGADLTVESAEKSEKPNEHGTKVSIFLKAA